MINFAKVFFAVNKGSTKTRCIQCTLNCCFFENKCLPDDEAKSNAQIQIASRPPPDFLEPRPGFLLARRGD